MNIPTAILITASAMLVACTGPSDTPIPRTSEAPNEQASAARRNAELGALETTLAYSEGIRAIKRLQHAYALYVSAGEWQHAAALLSDDGLVQVGEQLINGRQDFEQYLKDAYPVGASRDGWLNEHLIFSPVINILPEGDRAQGRWRLVSLQGNYGAEANWAGGIFENTYVLDDGIWEIEKLHFYPIYGGSYADGWRILKEETPETVAPIPFHYDADSAGVPSPRVRVAAAAAAASVATRNIDTAEYLAMLDARARQLIDEDLVTNLQNAFGYYMDRHMWDDVSDLFVQNGTLEFGNQGVYRGTASIGNAIAQIGAQPLAENIIDDRIQLHMIVDVAPDGMSASGRGTELQMLGQFAGDAYWGIGTFENRYVKDQGTWKLQSVHVYNRLLTDYSLGWAEDARPPQSASQANPSDEPPSQQHAAYPEFFVPPFRFAHPVTGKRSAPEYVAAVGELPAQVAELGRKLRVLNAYEGAENVSNAYGYYIDEFLWDGMADVFSIDGWKELSYIGRYVGRERVRDSVVSRYGRGGRRANSMTYHQKTQPVITVADDGMSARIRTRLFQLNSSRASPGSFISGIYENRVVNENGIWKISAMDLDYAWLANYDGGWANVEPGSSNRFAPDPDSLQGDLAPDEPLRGVVFAPYPEGQVDMAFHYANPVSGREPPELLREIY